MAFPEYISDTVFELDTYLLTSVDEIHRKLSYAGEHRRLDDMDATDDNYDTNNGADVTRDNALEEIIQRATSHVMSYLGRRYSIENIYRIPRLREIATDWACYKISRRRGNEPLFEEEMVEGIDELEGYSNGTRYLDAPSNGNRAYIQTAIIDNRFTRTSVRLLPEASTFIRPGQKVAWRFPFAWL